MISSLYSDAKYDALRNEVADGMSSGRTLGEQALVHLENRGFSAFKEDEDKFHEVIYMHDEVHCILEAVLQKIESETDRQPIKSPFPSNGNWLAEHIVLFFQRFLSDALFHADSNYDEYEAKERSLDSFIERIRNNEQDVLDEHNYNVAASWLIAHLSDEKGEFAFPEGPVSIFDVLIKRWSIPGFYEFDERDLPDEGKINKWGEVFNFHRSIEYDDLDLIYTMMMEPVVTLCEHIRAVAAGYPEIMEASDFVDNILFATEIVQSVSYDDVCSIIPDASEIWKGIEESYEVVVPSIV